MPDIYDQLKGLITTAYSPEATKTMSPSDTDAYKQAISLLGTTYGYNPQTSDFIIGTLSGKKAGDQIRDQYRQLGGGITDPQWGNTYDVEKNYGSIESLATYLAQGGKSQTQAAPTITNQFGGQEGGNTISTPLGQLPTGIKGISSSVYENQAPSISKQGPSLTNRQWGQKISGEMYPAVEGPGNPDWEARNPHYGGTDTDLLSKKTSSNPPTPVVPVKNYVRNPGGTDVYDKAGNYISAEKAATIPGFWDQVEITDQAPNTSKGSGLGGPVSGLNDGLGYVRYAGSPDVYEKATGKYIDFDTAKKLDIWNKVEDLTTTIDDKALKDLGIDPNAESVDIKDPDLKAQYAAVNPYQSIYDDYKKNVEKLNTELESLWLDYNLGVVEIEENPWLLSGEQTQELAKLKKQKMAKINALTSTKDSMTSEFNSLLGIQEKVTSWDQQQIDNANKQTPEEESAQGLADYEAKAQIDQKYTTEKEPGTSTINTNGHTYLINDSTGEIIKDLGVANSEMSSGGGGGDTVIDKFNKALEDYDSQIKRGVTREVVISRLQAKYSDIDASDIIRAVYEAYPDSYVNQFNQNG